MDVRFDCLDDDNSLIDEKCPTPTDTIETFAEIIVCENLVIPPQKPDKEHITNVLKKIIVNDIEVIEVDLGDPTKHKKLAITGTIKVGIEYSANEPEQQVHFAHFNVPFQAIVGKRPCDTTNRGLLPEDFDLDLEKLHICLEHEQFHQIDHRNIKAVFVLLIWLEP